MKAREIREQKPEETEEKLLSLKHELMKEKGQVATGSVPKSPGKIKQIKRNIAKILTVRNEQKIKKVKKE